MTTTPQQVLSDGERLACWTKHTAVADYKTYTLREHVLRALRDVESATLAKLQASPQAQADQLTDEQAAEAIEELGMHSAAVTKLLEMGQYWEDGSWKTPQAQPEQAAPAFGYFYMVNGVHERFSKGSEPPPDDTYDDGTLVACYTRAKQPARIVEIAHKALSPDTPIHPEEVRQLALAVIYAAPVEAQGVGEVAPAGSWGELAIMMEHSAWDGKLELSDALANIETFAAMRQSLRPQDKYGVFKVVRAALTTQHAQTGGEQV